MAKAARRCAYDATAQRSDKAPGMRHCMSWPSQQGFCGLVFALGMEIGRLERERDGVWAEAAEVARLQGQGLLMAELLRRGGHP